jgi:hypothetical protein
MTYNAEQITFMLAEAIDQNREYKSWHCSTQHLMALVERVVAEEREACAKIAETPIGEYEVVVACGTEPTPHRIPQYANWQDIATAIRARGQA